MKSFFHIAALFFIVVLSSLRLQAQDLLYFVELNSFYDTGGKPYVEINLDINAYSVAYVPGQGSLEGSVDVHYLISPKSDTTQHVYDRRFDLLSPPVTDTSRMGTAFGILDLRRVSLEPGEYVLTGGLKDNHRKGALRHRFTKEFIVDAQPVGKMSLSSVALIQSMTPTTSLQPHSKLGFDIVPMVNDGNYIDADSLRYYVETYNASAQTDGVFFVNTYLMHANSTSKMRNYERTTRHPAKPIGIVSGAFDIHLLGTGTYYLAMDVFNQKQEKIASTARKIFIISSRTVQQTAFSEEVYLEHFDLDEKKLDYYIRVMSYISTNTERDFAASLSTLSEKQNYFYNFWDKRKEKPIDPPSKPWTQFQSRVTYANDHYKAAHLEGWATDRGRVLIVQGTPNEIELYPSSNTLHPHEIWRYNKLLTQANVRFIFFNPNEATNDWVLLHSDLRGERNNPRYEFDLARSTMDGNLDVNKLDGTKQR